MKNETHFPLHMLPIGGKARIAGLSNSGQARRRLLDLGLTQGTTIEAVQKSPAGDPVAYFFRGVVIALRREDAGMILCEHY